MKRVFALLLMMCLLCGCAKAPLETAKENEPQTEESVLEEVKELEAPRIPLNRIDDKYRTFYEVFVYSFCDSDGDGIGDLKGLISKLDYINDGDDTTDTDLSFDGIWLMPIMPSESYHKYDVDDYYAIDKDYGTMEDFDVLISECNQRNINVIIDLVINHTSDTNPWFLEACKYLRDCAKNKEEPNEADCPYFGYYNFSLEKPKTQGYLVSGTDYYYEAPFDSGMPDLNLYNENVRKEIEDIVTFWLDKGVSGFRLDAVKEYVSGNTPKNVEILTWFNDMVKSHKEDAYLVGECWTTPERYVQYYQSGIDSLFDFYFADGEGTIAIGAKTSNKSVTAQMYAERCERIHNMILEQNPNGIDAPFFSNHDMDRAAGYFKGENGAYEIKMAAAMNLMMSGCAFVYYGDEIGMNGKGRDENKRAYMYWSEDTSYPGMCKGPKNMETIEMRNPSLEVQMEDPNSLYNFYKHLIQLRNQNPEIARGDVKALQDLCTKEVAVIQKTWEGSDLLILMNLSAEPQTVDLSAVTLNQKSADAFEVRGEMYAKEDTKGTLEGKVLTLPEFSLWILK